MFQRLVSNPVTADLVIRINVKQLLDRSDEEGARQLFRMALEEGLIKLPSKDEAEGQDRIAPDNSSGGPGACLFRPIARSAAQNS